MNFYDANVWELILTLSFLLIAMLIANLLRRVIPFLRRMLLPSSVIAGFMLLLIGWAYKEITGNALMDGVTLEIITYHGLGIGFVAVALRLNEKIKQKEARRDIFNTGLTVVSSYVLQGIIGLAITLGLSYVISNVFPASGLLLPMGFGQGPGQALTWGHNYSKVGFTDGDSFGLTVAAMGFIAASVGGVFYLWRLQKTGRIKINPDAESVENLSAEQVTVKGEIPLSESMDKMTVQIGLVITAYIAAYGIMYGLRQLFLALNVEFLLTTVDPLIWGFNFLIGTVTAILLKSVLEALRKKGVIKRQYINNFLLNRFSNFMFDLMVTASIAAINLNAFTKVEFILPLSLICVAGAVVTYIQCKFISERIFPKYKDEMFLALYGMLTGTLSTGIILLRESDPNMETSAAPNLVYQSLYAIIFGFPILLLMGMAYKPIGDNPNGWAWLTLLFAILMLAAMTVLLFRRQIFKKTFELRDKAAAAKVGAQVEVKDE